MAHLMDIVKKGSTDRSVAIRIVDSGDGTPETGVVYNTSGIDLWYRREGAAKTSITEASLSALTDAHSDGGFLHVGDGEYRLDLPDAAFASGANYVDIGGTVTGMVVIGGRVRLVNYDPEDGVRLGLTALPNAAADAAGGLPISDAGGLDLDAQIGADIDAILVDTGTDLPGSISGLVTLDELETALVLLGGAFLVTGTVASAGTNNIDLGSLATFGYADDDLNDCLIRFRDESQTRYHSAWITDFVASTSVVTLDAALPFTTENGVDTYTIYAIRRNIKAVEMGGGATGQIAEGMFADTGLTYNGDAETNSVMYEMVEKLKRFLQLLARKDAAIATDNATELSEINANEGSGAGAFANTTDSGEAIRDRGDAAWVTGTALDAAGVRAAVGLASANLDTQLGDLPTAGENADAVWDETRSGHTTSGTFGESFNGVVSGQAATGTLSTTEMTTNLTEATDDHYIGRVIVWITGALAGQATDITDYVGSTKKLVFSAVTDTPSDGDRFVIV